MSDLTIALPPDDGNYSSPSTQSHLHKLPPEVRRQIYHYYFASLSLQLVSPGYSNRTVPMQVSARFENYKSPARNRLALLIVSREIREEALPFMRSMHVKLASLAFSTIPPPAIQINMSWTHRLLIRSITAHSLHLNFVVLHLFPCLKAFHIIPAGEMRCSKLRILDRVNTLDSTVAAQTSGEAGRRQENDTRMIASNLTLVIQPNDVSSIALNSNLATSRPTTSGQKDSRKDIWDLEDIYGPEGRSAMTLEIFDTVKTIWNALEISKFIITRSNVVSDTFKGTLKRPSCKIEDLNQMHLENDAFLINFEIGFKFLKVPMEYDSVGRLISKRSDNLSVVSQTFFHVLVDMIHRT